MSVCVFQGTNYDTSMRDLSSFVKNIIGHSTDAEPESTMTHELIKERTEYTAEIKYSSQCLQGICPIKFKLEKIYLIKTDIQKQSEKQ